MPVIGNNRPQRLSAFRWGLVPWWAKDLKMGDRFINARIEDLPRRAAFKSGETRRCLVLADGFYEWKREGKRKAPWFFELEDHRPFAFAGIWDSWKQPDGARLLSCTLLTTQAAGLPATVHDRMPVVLPRDLYATWLSREAIPLETWAPRLGECRAAVGRPAGLAVRELRRPRGRGLPRAPAAVAELVGTVGEACSWELRGSSVAWPRRVGQRPGYPGRGA